MSAAVMRFIGANNGYLPETTKQVIGYVRDPRKNKLNEYLQYVWSPKPTAYYTRVERDAFLRRKKGAQAIWQDGDSRPLDNGNKLRHKVASVETIRTNYSWHLGYQTIKNSDLYRVQPSHVTLATSQAILERYTKVYDILEASGNYGSTDSATNLGGGKWDVGTASAPYFAKGILAAANAIYLATGGVVEITDLICVLSPTAALKIGASAEMHAWYSNSVYAKEMATNPHGMVNRQWGLPPEYMGMKLIVEGKQYTDSAQDDAGTDSATLSYFKSDDNASIIARVGGIDGVPGEIPFSSIQCYYYGDKEKTTATGPETVEDGANLMLDVKVFDDPENERVAGHVSQQIGVSMVSPESSYFVSDILT